MSNEFDSYVWKYMYVGVPMLFTLNFSSNAVLCAICCLTGNQFSNQNISKYGASHASVVFTSRLSYTISSRFSLHNFSTTAPSHRLDRAPAHGSNSHILLIVLLAIQGRVLQGTVLLYLLLLFALARVMVHAVESVVIEWTHQIREVLKKDSAQPLLEGLNPIPYVEMEFWKVKAQNLECIYDQVDDSSVQRVVVVACDLPIQNTTV